MSRQLLLLQKSLFFAISLLLLIPAYGQSKKGFKQLKKKQIAEAAASFKQDLNHPVLGVAARYGLAACALADGENLYALLGIYPLNQEALTQYQALEKKSQKKKLKKLKIIEPKLAQQTKDLQRSALNQIEKSMDLLALDSFMQVMTPLHRHVETSFKTTREKVVQYAIRNANDYPTLSSLAKNHSDWVLKKNYRFKRSLQDRLLWAFLSNPGPEHLATFIKDHPNHSFSIDCWSKELAAALQTKEISALLDFLNEYPMSTLDRFCANTIYSQTNYGRQIPNEQHFSPAQRVRMEELKEHWELQRLTNRRDMPADFRERLDTVLQRSAPSTRAYELFKSAIQMYLKNKQWQAAEELAVTYQPYFPDEQPADCNTRYYFYSTKQEWFNTAIPIFRRPAQGIELSPLAAINTAGDEFSPVVSLDGGQLFFAASGRDENVGGEDIFVSKFNRKKKIWKDPKLVKELSTEANEAPLSMTSDGRHLLLFVDGKLHLSTFDAKNWSTPEPLPEAINAFPWIGRACISADGKVLIFSASEDPQEFYAESNIDIYVSEKDLFGKWGTPYSIGTTINTDRQERSPYLHTDMKTLYFSSNGQSGLGGMDVFRVQRTDSTSWTAWSEPLNLGKEINTLEDDWNFNYSMTNSGETMYLSIDNTIDGHGDIYASGLPTFAQPENLRTLIGKVKRETDLPLRTTVVIRNAETGAVIAEVETLEDGTFYAPIPPGIDVKYHLKDPTLFPASKTVRLSELEGEETVAMDTVLALSYYDMLNKHVPARVYFDYNMAELKAEFSADLVQLAAVCKRKDDWLIQINGHTDNEGNDRYNKRLSLQRAKAIRDFLAEQGVPLERMKIQGLGSEQPLTPNALESDQAPNRRVEIFISTNKN